MDNTHENAYQFWKKHQSMSLTDLLVEWADECLKKEVKPSGEKTWVDIIEEGNKTSTCVQLKLTDA